MKIKRALSVPPFLSLTVLILAGMIFSPHIAGADPVVITPDSVSSSSFKTPEATCQGNYPETHINLGFGTSVTGRDDEDDQGCVIGGGWNNTISASMGTVSGGGMNTASSGGATVGGGYENVASGSNSVVAGGRQNTASGQSSAVLGGFSNTASGTNSVVGGGFGSEASGERSTVVGGGSNLASGYVATVGGGYRNTAAGDYSWAGGRHMKLEDTADHTFVWGDAEYTEQSISTADAFLIFPKGTSGKVGIGTASPAEKLHIRERSSTMGAAVLLDSTGGTSGRQFFVGSTLSGNVGGAGLFQIYDDTANQPRLNIDESGNVGIGITAPTYKLHVNGTAAGTSWTNLSSREYKDNIRRVDQSDYQKILAQLMEMELTTYTYRQEYGGDGDTKLGFIAEEMPAEVLSRDKKGVDIYELLTFTIGAIKAQQNEIQEQQQENEQLKQTLKMVIERLEDLENKHAQVAMKF